MIRIFLVAAAIAMTQACVSVRSSHGYVLERDQTQLTGEIGFDTKESILAKYGEPSMIGTFDRNAWYYMNVRDQARAFFRPDTQDRNVVAFYFDEDGKMRDLQKFTLEDGAEFRMSSRKTPTRGKELNFWEQLLGNVGQLPAAVGQGPQAPGQ